MVVAEVRLTAAFKGEGHGVGTVILCTEGDNVIVASTLEDLVHAAVGGQQPMSFPPTQDLVMLMPRLTLRSHR